MKNLYVSVKISNHKLASFLKIIITQSSSNKILFQTYLNLKLKYPPWKPGKINLLLGLFVLISCTILALDWCFSSRHLNFLPINQKVHRFFCFNSWILENCKSRPFRLYIFRLLAVNNFRRFVNGIYFITT